ncbi:MAG TPA: hopanoid biosynthesis-associated RND transporter HpnN, partial [Stellaceae bacterium]|nr:hopanoid biosynthesis-associated RND transporter HpnN [Stellaceae bacterium]
MATLIAQLVEWSRRHAVAVTVVVLLATLLGANYTVDHISIDTDIDKLINPDLPWRKQEKALDEAFPQDSDLMVIVIDGKTPDQAEDAAAALTERLSKDPLFRNVRRPEGGTFFQQNGLLLLPKKDVQDFADQIVKAQPFIGTLAADPSLRGVFD